MAKTIRLKESDLTRIVRTISESQLLLEWRWKSWVLDFIKIGKLVDEIYGWFDSDSRLKKNIRRVGKSPSGIPIYEFEYKNKTRFGKGTFRGVLAEQAPRRAVKVSSNGYKKVDYGMLDVDFERVNPRKTRLSERDLSRVIGRVINERRWEMPDLTKGTVFLPDMDIDGWMGGQSQGGGSNDPMAAGNEQMETDGRDEGKASGEDARMMSQLVPLMGSLNSASSFMQTLTPESVGKDGQSLGGLHGMIPELQEIIGAVQMMVSQYESSGRLVIPPIIKDGGKGWWRRTWLKFANWFAECPPDGTPLPC